MKPIFEDLCSKYAKRGKVAFVTVEANHENPQCAVQLSIFEQEGGRGLPTFKIYYGDKCWKTITGANRPELTKSVADALTLPDTSRSSGTGRTLGGNAPRASLRRPLKWDFNKLVNAVITFVGLYFVSLFTVGAHSPSSSTAPLCDGDSGSCADSLYSSTRTWRRKNHSSTSPPHARRKYN